MKNVLTLLFAITFTLTLADDAWTQEKLSDASSPAAGELCKALFSSGDGQSTTRRILKEISVGNFESYNKLFIKPINSSKAKVVQKDLVAFFESMNDLYKSTGFGAGVVEAFGGGGGKAADLMKEMVDKGMVKTYCKNLQGNVINLIYAKNRSNSLKNSKSMIHIQNAVYFGQYASSADQQDKIGGRYTTGVEASTCLGGHKLNGNFGENCSLLPSHIKNGNDSSLSSSFEVLQDIHLLNTKSVLTLNGDSSQCKKCLGKTLKNRDGTESDIDKIKAASLQSVKDKIRAKNLGTEMHKLAGVVETLVDFDAVRGNSVTDSKSSLIGSCSDSKKLKKIITETCSRDGSSITDAEVNKRLSLAVKDMGINSNNITSDNILGLLVDKISYSENKKCEPNSKNVKRNSRAVYQQRFTEQMYADKDNISSRSLGLVLDTLYYSGVRDEICNSGKEIKSLKDKIGEMVTQQSTLLEFEFKTTQTEASMIAYDNHIKELDLIGKDYSEIISHGGKTNLSKIDIGAFAVENVVNGDPLLNILFSNKEALCDVLEKNNDLESYLRGRDEEAGKALREKHNVIAEKYASKCDDSFKKIAELTCSKNKEEENLEDIYTPRQLRNIMEERIDEITNNPSGITTTEQNEIIGFGAVTCSFEAVANKSYDSAPIGITDTIT
jgi:hypothetical protein